MKKVFTLSMVACYIFISLSSKSQVRITTGFTVQANLPVISATSFDRFRVQGGLISHFASGAVGSFGATDKWIGIGAPLSSLYGNRIQWNGQALNSALRERTAGGIKDALIEWGNGGGEMQFRYITDPSVSTGFAKILSLTAAGNGYVGDNPSSLFTPSLFVTTPILTPKFEINSTSALGLGVTASTGNVVAQFKGNSGNTNDYIVKVDCGPNVYDASVNTVGMRIIAANGKSNEGLNVVTSGSGIINTNPFSSESSISISGSASSGGYSTTGISGSASGAFASSGVSGVAYGATNCYGISGVAYPSPGQVGYAGYFNGSVIANSYTTFSDRNLKKSISTETNNIIEQIKKLRPVTYNYDNKISPDMVLPNTLQHGFIAQEIQVVFPEVVTEIVHPIYKENKIVGTKKVLGVNYNMLVSILTKAIQEENTQIKNLESRIAELESKLSTTLQKSASPNINGIESIKDVILNQNTPNPFGGSTTISYSLPANIKNASIAVFDLTGKMLLKFDNIINGKSQVVIDGNKLSSGIYLYSLLIDGAEITTKRMVISK
jgi:Chaperone of endosialidase/Secretion system C-terminal sorting domain